MFKKILATMRKLIRKSGKILKAVKAVFESAINLVDSTKELIKTCKA